MITYTTMIQAEDYIRLRKAVGWTPISIRQAREGLVHTAYLCAATDNGTVVAMSRLLFDYGYVGYIADVIVLPEYQRQGIGSHMMGNILDWINTQIEPDDFVQINLAAAKGKEPFYRKFGFTDRPDAVSGAGMMKRIQKNRL